MNEVNIEKIFYGEKYQTIKFETRENWWKVFPKLRFYDIV